MTDKTPESGLEVPELKAPPVPEISEPSGDERPSAAAVDADTLAARVAAQVLEQLDQTIDRKMQSTKDKRLSALDGLDVASLKRFAALAKEVGEDKAIRELAIDKLIERQASPAGDPGRSPKVETRDTSVILAEVKNDLGVEIAPDDPDLISLAKKSYSSWDAWQTAVVKLGARKAKQANAPTSVVAETPQKPPSGGSLEAAQEKLARLQANPKTTSADLQSAFSEVREALSRQR
jgi:hypothetical protein